MSSRLHSAAASLVLGAALLTVVGMATPAAAARIRCHGETATIVGTPGKDVLQGTPRRDVVAGRGGNDTLLGLGGNDVLCGGPGSDRLDGGAGDDQVLGGRDLVEGGETPYHRGDELVGGRGDDLLDAGYDARGPSGGGDVVSWSGSDHGVRVDLVAGTARGEGRDRVRLRDGKIYLSQHDDTFTGTPGPDEVHALGGADDVRTGAGDDVVHADDEEGFDEDRVVAGTGDDSVDGRGPDDVRGGDGRDLLVVTGPGVHTAYGGAGRDRIEVVVLAVPGHHLAGGDGRDRVLVELANSSDAGSMLDLGTGELFLEDAASTATGFEDAEVYFGPFMVTGTDGANDVRTQDDASAVTFLGLGGDDTFSGGELDDHFDGGEGTDAYLSDEGGTNTCVDVEQDPNLFCGA